MKKIYNILFQAFILLTVNVTAQEPRENWELESTETDTRNYVARDYVALKKGFTYKANGTDKFSAKIDQCLLFPPTDKTYLMADGSLSSTITEGATGTVVGSIPGKFDVSPSGAATYAVPIEVPAGVNGMQPNLSLVYNSQAGNGIAGWGWNIGGLSMIKRAPRNLLDDNLSSSIIWDNESPLEFDGCRLVKMNQWANDSVEYKTSNESYNKVIAYNIKQSGPSFLKVYFKNGNVGYYGSTENSCWKLAKDISLAWCLSKIVDSNGNRIDFEYASNTISDLCFDYRILSVKYGANNNASATNFSEIKFNYFERPDYIDVYINGYELKNTQRLSSIDVVVNGIKIREYSINYNNDKNFSWLESIQLKGISEQILTPVKFENLESKNIEFSVDTLYKRTTDDVLGLGGTDFTGDGKDDFFVFHGGCMGTVSGPVPATKYRFGVGIINSESKQACDFVIGDVVSQGNYFTGFQNKLIGDFFSRGYSSIVKLNKFDKFTDVTYYSMSDFVLQKTKAPEEKGPYRFQTCEDNYNYGTPDPFYVTGDFDGLLGDELILINNEPRSITAGYQYKARIIWNTGESSESFYINTTSKIYQVEAGDFYGQGRNDLLLVLENSSGILKNIYSGYDFFVKDMVGSDSSKINGLDSKCLYTVGALNHDNLQDIIFRASDNSWIIAMNCGNGLFINSLQKFICDDEAGSDKDHDNVMIVDLNNDGYNDIVIADEVLSKEYNKLWGYLERYNYDKTNWRYFVNTNYGYKIYKKFSDYEHADRVYFGYGDLNNSGIKEWMKFSSTGGDLQIYTSKDLYDSHKINKIKNNTSLFISYSNLSNFKCDKFIYNDYVPFNKSNVSVVSKYGDEYFSNTMNYENGIYHTKGRGFVGFLKQSNINNKTGIETVTNFKLEEKHALLLPDSLLTRLNSSVVDLTIFDYSIVDDVEHINHFEIRKSNEKTSNILSSITSEKKFTNYDTDGNPQEISIDYGGGRSEKQIYTYIQKGSWCKNKIESISATYSQSECNDINRKTEYRYLSNGNLFNQIQDVGDKNQISTEYPESEYDVFGNPQLIKTSANGETRQTRLTYTPSGRFVASKTNVELGKVVSYQYDEAKGVMTSQTDETGVTSYDYDGFGRLKKTVLPNKVQSVSLLQWASGEQRPDGAIYYGYQETSGSSPVTIWFDSLGREIRRDSYDLNGKLVKVSTEYNSLGQVWKVSEPYYDNITSYATINKYDPYGRIETVTTPSDIIKYTYDIMTTKVSSLAGCSETKLNAAGQTEWSKVNGKSVTYTYWPSGLTKTAKPDGGIDVEMVYDLQGNRTQLTDPDAGIIKSEYNGFGELLNETHPGKDGDIKTIYKYRNDGLLESKTVKGEETKYDYDERKRLKLIEISGKNKQVFSYDEYNRVVQVDETIGSENPFSTRTEYDAFGRVKKEFYPTGYYIINGYDKNGYLVSVKDKYDNAIWNVKEANVRGQLTRTAQGGRDVVYGYDPTTAIPNRIASGAIIDMSYEFSKSGNLMSRSDNLMRQNETFVPDDMNRLKEWKINNSITHSIVYDDKLGNITSKSDIGYEMNYGANGQPHALTSISGNPGIIPDDEQTITYTDFNKIATITEGTNSLKLCYGVDQQRRKGEFVIDGKTFTRYYLGNYEEQHNSDNSIRKIHYIAGGNGQAAIFVQNGGKDSLYYTYCDYQGNLLVVTDQVGKEVDRYAYDAWGARRNPSNWAERDARKSHLFARGYTLHEHLDAFGVINMNGRAYDPAVARFLSPDPFIQAPGDWGNYNRYGYCMNNPLVYSDPSGEFILESLLAIVIAETTTNYITSGLNNWINNGMSFDNAFGKNATISAGAYYSPIEGTWGNSFGDEFAVRQACGFAELTVNKSINAVRSSYGYVADLDWSEISENSIRAIPVFGAARSAGQNLNQGNYLAASIDEAYAFLDLFTLGYGSRYRAAIYGMESCLATTEQVAAKTSTNVLSKGEFLRIENAATRINKPITVVGSRAKGTAGAYSDWDYVIPELNSKNWSKIKNSLPGARSVLDNTPRNIDIFKGPVNINLPYITIYPR